MAVPMVHRDRILGVLEVLDPAPQSRSSLDELDLLVLFARQAATALRIVVDRDRAAGSRAEAGLDLDVRAAAQQLIVNLQRLMGVAPA
jgi:GAF domain-containing protein